MGSKKKVLVCVTQQKNCERLIKRGAEVRDELGGELFVIHVAANGVNILGNSSEGDALEYLFGISKMVGAELNVLRSDNVVKTIAEFAKENKISKMILGGAPDDCDTDVTGELKRKLPYIEISIVPPEEYE